jgi:hypothetical protein
VHDHHDEEDQLELPSLDGLALHRDCHWHRDLPSLCPFHLDLVAASVEVDAFDDPHSSSQHPGVPFLCEHLRFIQYSSSNH